MTTATPKKRKRGGQPGPRLAPEERTQPRSVRLNDTRWAKLKALGSEWLTQAIDRAKPPAL